MSMANFQCTEIPSTPGYYDCVQSEKVLKALTCTACGEAAATPYFCSNENCGAIACEKHLGQTCYECGIGTWAVKAHALAGLLNSFRENVASAEPWVPSTDVPALSASDEVKGMARFCSKRGKCWMYWQPVVLPAETLEEIYQRLLRDGLWVVIDQYGSGLAIFCDPELLETQGVQEIPPDDICMRVDRRDVAKSGL